MLIQSQSSHYTLDKFIVHLFVFPSLFRIHRHLQFNRSMMVPSHRTRLCARSWCDATSAATASSTARYSASRYIVTHSLRRSFIHSFILYHHVRHPRRRRIRRRALRTAIAARGAASTASTTTYADDCRLSICSLYFDCCRQGRVHGQHQEYSSSW